MGLYTMPVYILSSVYFSKLLVGLLVRATRLLNVVNGKWGSSQIRLTSFVSPE